MSEKFSYRLTEPELYQALCKTRRRASPVRLWIQTAVLVLLGAGFLLPYVTDRFSGGSWLIGSALWLFAAAQWFVPHIAFSREAGQLAADGVTVKLTVDETTITAGEQTTVTAALADTTFLAAGELLVWRPDRVQSIVIPHRAVSETVWERLCRYV